jgi:hypothetical protein
MKTMHTILLGGLLAASSVAGAAVLAPSSYDMPNGGGVAHGGEFNYWDKNYSGSGDTTLDNAPLSGGLGDLTDGVVSTLNWFNTENAAGSGPYVGWRVATLAAPLTVVFHFAHAVDIDHIAIHTDDSAGSGGVDAPASVRLVAGTVDQLFPVVDPSSDSAPFFINLSNLGISAVTSVALSFNAKNEWVFLDEVSFDGAVSTVPVPGAALLLASALPLLRLRRRRIA